MKWIWFLGLSVCAVTDFRYRKIPLWLLKGGFAAGIGNIIFSDVTENLAGMAVGMVILLAGRMTRGAMGDGDGYFFLITACFCTWKEVWLLFWGGLTISWFWSTAIMMKNIKKGLPCKGTVPFITCIWPVGLMIMLQNGV